MTTRIEEATFVANALNTAKQLVESSGVLDLLEEWRKEDRQKDNKKHPGPKLWMNEKQYLILKLMLAIQGKPLLITFIRDFLITATDEQYKILELERVTDISAYALYNRIYNTGQRVKALMNPEYAFSLRSLVTHAEAAVFKQTLQTDRSKLLKDRAELLANQLLHASFLSLPRQNRHAIMSHKLDVCMDGTHIPSPGVPRSAKRSVFASSDFTAGIHKRDGDHNAEDTSRVGKYKRSKEKFTLAREITTVANYRVDDMPTLIVAMSFDNPGADLPSNSMIAINSLLSRGFRPGYYVADRAYAPGQKAENLQLPLRNLGYSVIMDHKSNELGDGYNKGAQGFRNIEGKTYCPHMPEPLVNTSIDHQLRQKDDPERIDSKVYFDRIKRREEFEVKTKQSVDEQGYYRVSCPARGPYATVKCPRVEPHQNVVDKALPRVFAEKLPDDMLPKCCAQGSVTLHVGMNAKYQQELAYKSEKWLAEYGKGRSVIENMNKMLKMAHTTSVHERNRRPARGYFSQLLYVTMAIVATNARIIYLWMRRQAEAEQSQHVKQVRSPRRKRIPGWQPLHQDSGGAVLDVDDPPDVGSLQAS